MFKPFFSHSPVLSKHWEKSPKTPNALRHESLRAPGSTAGGVTSWVAKMLKKHRDVMGFFTVLASGVISSMAGWKTLYEFSGVVRKITDFYVPLARHGFLITRVTGIKTSAKFIEKCGILRTNQEDPSRDDRFRI